MMFSPLIHFAANKSIGYRLSYVLRFKFPYQI